jgi:hypothetical protein
MANGAVGLALRWTATDAPKPETARAVAALCAAHPGPAPVLIEWGEGNGGGNGARALLRSRTLKVDAADDLVAALRDLLGADAVHFRKAS